MLIIALKTRGHYLLPREAAPAWEVFEEMQQRGVLPDSVTYNSLITLCARSQRPDAARALQCLEEMGQIGIPITDVTLSALAQCLGRANQVRVATLAISA